MCLQSRCDCVLVSGVAPVSAYTHTDSVVASDVSVTLGGMADVGDGNGLVHVLLSQLSWFFF